MHKELYESLLFLRNFFYHIPIWDVLELLHMEIPLGLLHMELPLIISEDMVQVV